MMKAITYSNYGPPDVLQLRSVAMPSCGSAEILIKVHAAEATKADCELRSFRFSVRWFWLPLRIALGIFRPRRQILGGYFAGEIAAVGDEVGDFQVGDHVFGSAGLRMGAYGEYVALPASNTIVLKPGNMNFAEAAAVPLGGLNALHFMRLANVQPGEQVLINGAGGVIGAHAVQIAKSMGAVVTAVDKAAKADFVRRIGADHFIDYRHEDFRVHRQAFDVMFDMVPGSSYSACMQVLRKDGRYLSGNPRLSIMIRCLLTEKFTARSATCRFAAETREELRTLKEMIEDGRIKPIVDQVFPMEQAADAHRRVEAEQRLGAVIIRIAEP